MREEPTRIETDVLVIGGGVAGCLAALMAREAGASVLISEKGGVIERSGSVAGGVDQFLTVMETGPEWDTPDGFLKYIPGLTDGIVDMQVTTRVIHHLQKALRKLESIGIDFRDPDTGEYSRHRSFGLPGTYHLDFDGTDFKRILGQAVRRAGVKSLTRTMAVQVLVRDGRALGALVFHFRTGEWYVIQAKATILTTGDINRLSKNASGLPYDSWHCPFNTGDGHSMGFRAGASLVNMEFIEATLTPRGFSTQGTNAFTGLGAHFLNRHGERFMLRYDPKAERARRSVLVDAMINEILSGNAPIYMQVSHLPMDQIEFLERTMGIDRATLPAYYRQKKIDLKKDPVEFAVSEFSIRRSGLYYRGSGMAVDETGETSVTGLFAAGDCASVSGGISGAASLGYIAGEGAAARARKTRSMPEVDPASFDALREWTFADLLRETGLSPREFEDQVREITTGYLGFRRTGEGIAHALRELARLEQAESAVKAKDLHDLMRATEAKSLRLAAELLARSALVREESRTGSAHRRLDYPETDDARWRKFILVERGADGRPVTRTHPADEPLRPVAHVGEGGNGHE